MIDLKAKPFRLTDEAIIQVENTLAAMTEDEKIGQLLCPSLATFDEAMVKHYTQTACSV